MRTGACFRISSSELSRCSAAGAEQRTPSGRESTGASVSRAERRKKAAIAINTRLRMLGQPQNQAEQIGGTRRYGITGSDPAPPRVSEECREL
jgi:hypothetical protein